MAASKTRLPDDSGNTGPYLATYTYTHDAVTAHAEPTVPVGSDGVPLGTVTNPLAANYATPTATTGSITAASQQVTATCNGHSTASVQITGTFTTHISVVQGSCDGGTTWHNLEMVSTAGAVTPTFNPTDSTAMLVWVNCSGLTHVRLNALAHVSGTGNITILLSAAPGPPLQSAAGSDGATVGGMAVGSNLWNGTTWDRPRGNTQGTAIASGARTATNNSADITNYSARGVQIMLNVSSAGTGSIQPNVQGKDPVSSGYYKLAADPTAVTTAALFVYEFYPGASTAAAGGVTARVACSVPRTFRIIVTHGNANSITYSCGYSLLV